ncbi:unnamed protein product [Prunus armeniaca]|uniref:Uncharacterized protein n=1 Tax=Prunus armeniaca TaxID=36596 RepID=A0A6J5Y6H0_PRUAR|nr:unnamed protein product [Prunus armeniaca]
MELEEEVLEPVSPTGHYFTSSVLSVSNLAVLETEIPFDESQTMSLVQSSQSAHASPLSWYLALSLSLSLSLSLY